MKSKHTLDPENLKGVQERARGSRLSEQSVREDYLDRLGRMMSDVDVKTTLGDDAISYKEDSQYFIIVPTDIAGQHQTSLSENVWELLFQETIFFHELGHILWTDFDYLKEVCDEHEYGEQVRTVWNGMEDGCIETYLSIGFKIGDDLTILNTNLVEEYWVGRDDISPFRALGIGLQDQGFFDSGIWDDIVSGDIDVEYQDTLVEFDSRVKEVMEQALDTKDSQKRLDLAVEITEEFIEELPDNEPDSQDQEGEGSEGEDGNEDVGPTGNSDGESENSSGGQQEQPPTPSNPDDREQKTRNDASNVEDSVEQEKRPNVESQSGGDSPKPQKGQDTDDIEEQLIQMASGSNLGEEIYIPDWDTGYGARKDSEKARLRGRSLSEILKRILQDERYSSCQYGREEGHLDTGELAYAVSGSRDIYWNTNKPEDKNYSVQIILDRSSSMDDKVRAAQRATLQLAYGLMMVGVDVSVISFYNEDPYLEIPFGGEVSEYEDQVLSGKAAGSTPLGDVISLSHEHVQNGSFDNYFMIVVTDGEPTGQEQKRKYKRILNESEYPVYGVYIGSEKNHDEYFDYVTYAVDHTIEQRCRELCESLVNLEVLTT